MNGYANAAYAAALRHAGTPRLLPFSGGWLLEQSVPNTPARDARGCYPLFACPRWTGLPADLDALEGELAAVTLVTDPFGQYDADLLQRCFPDLLQRYKEHQVIDCAEWTPAQVHHNHARNARAALRLVDVEQWEAPDGDVWAGLYGTLIERHQIAGIAHFPPASLRAQLQVPGSVVFRAVAAGETVGVLVWYVMQDVAYYHLAAYSQRGYDLRASFALFWHAIAALQPHVRWLCLGAGAGTFAAEDGLTRFKRGWATGTRPVYLCGRILHHAAYAELTQSAGQQRAAFFPQYRAGTQP